MSVRRARLLQVAWPNLANILVIAALVLPLLLMALGSLQTERDLLDHPHDLLPQHITFSNILGLALGRQGPEFPEQLQFYPHAFLNSTVIAVSVTAIVTVFGGLSAWSFARLRFRGRRIVPYGVLTVRMVPLIILIIPLYTMMVRAKLLGTPLAIIIPQAGLFLPYTIWILISYFASIPSELEEAARIDGCSRFGAFLRIILPLSAPGLTANAVIIFLLSWNDLLLPIIMTSKVEQMTLPVLISSIVTLKYFSYTLTYAAGLLATLPTLLLALLLQRYVVGGLTAGAVKG
jgi:multiple sugar transport system permease protein